MLLVLDSNEYIFSFGLLRERDCKKLIEVIRNKYPKHIIRTPRLIIEEVGHHLTPEDFREFIEFISALTTIDENILVPFELGAKYESKGLKPADAFIAAYAEWVGADILVTENRHFLTLHIDLPFRILPAKKCLKLLKDSK